MGIFSKKFLSILITVAIIFSTAVTMSFAADSGEIVVIYTNDTHCAVDEELRIIF